MTSLVPFSRPGPPARRYRSEPDSRPVPHWGFPEIRRLVETIRETHRPPRGDQYALLVMTLFDGALRIGEALGIAPRDLIRSAEGYRVRVEGKTGWREAAISPNLAERLRGYAWDQKLALDVRYWPFSPSRAHEVISEAEQAAGLVKPVGVGAVHILRHSGAIERMRITGDPKAVQDQLGHTTAGMTLRYMKTLLQEEGIARQEKVDYQW